MGNANRDLLKRLLHLLPVKIVKEGFEEKGSAVDIIEAITGNETVQTIKNFVAINQCYTRQNIYLYTLDKNFNRADIGNDFPLTIELENQQQGEFFCLPKVVFSVYLSAPTDKEDLIFYQPVTIRVQKRNLVIHYTKLESNVKFHYPANREAKKNGEQNSEESTLKQIIEYFEQYYTVEVNDINKGIKHMWHVDSLDCHKISYRDPHSVTTTLMDGTLTFKKKYSKEYAKIIGVPINSAIWSYLLKDSYLCDGFTADLSAGKVSVTKFPNDSNQVNNVITTILANN